MSPRRITAVALAAGLALAACGGSDDAAPAEPAPTEAPAAADDAGDAGEEAPASASDAPEILQFSADLVGGGTLDASTLAGTPTAFWFWAPT